MKNISYSLFNQESIAPENDINTWLLRCLDHLGIANYDIHYIFCTDEELLTINKTHLNHDYYTDIITFDNSDNSDECLESDIFISLDRIEDNAKSLKIPVLEEQKRVMIHGILHLCGYSDKTTQAQSIMRTKENFYINL